MDPLSVSAAVAGLLTITAKVAQVLNDVIRRSRHAPEACRRVRDAVGDLRGILGQLQRSMLGTRALSAERTSLIMVDQVVATLSACVTMFSDLDVFAEGLQSDENMGLLDRLRWVAKERDLRAVLEQLEVRKSSLTLMLSILTWYINPVGICRTTAHMLQSEADRCRSQGRRAVWARTTNSGAERCASATNGRV